MGYSSSTRRAGTDFATLEPRIQHVSKAVVKRRWKRLPQSSQDGVRNILTSARQLSRNTSSGRTASIADIESCIDQVTERLITRLPRMPFPISSSEESFDFELTLQRISRTEEQLASNLNSIQLLQTQILREEQLLSEDRQEVASLQQSLKAANRLRGSQAKKLHPLSRSVRLPGHVSTFCDEAHVTERKSESNQVGFDSLERSHDSHALIAQLAEHLDSLHGNIESMQPVMQAMTHVNQALTKLQQTSTTVG